MLTGILMVLAFPRFGAAWGLDHLIWIVFVPLLAAAEGVGAKRGFLLGWLAGMTLEAGGFLWILTAIRNFGSANVFVSSLLFLGWLIWETLPWALLGASLGRCRRTFHWLLTLAFFVGLEFWYPRVFPWHVGGAIWARTTLLQTVDLLGASGMTALIFLVNGTIWRLLQACRGRRPVPWVLVACSVALVVGALLYGNWRHAQLERLATPRSDGPKPLRIGFVQGNFDPRARSLETYIAESRKLHGESAEPLDLIVWPEGADSRPGFDITPGYPEWILHRRAERPGGYILKGELPPVPHVFGASAIVHGMPQEGRPLEILESYNVAAYLRRDGQLSYYRKNKPVPFGEMVPGLDLLPADLRRSFREVFPFVGNLDLGEDNPLFELGEHRFRNLICYEAVIPASVRDASPGADFIVNITEDAWYGDTAHIPQHRSVLILRSVECRTPIVRVTNIGPSGIVDLRGHFDTPDRCFERLRFTREFVPVSVDTVYLRFGHHFPTACLLVWLVGGVLRWRRARRESGSETASGPASRL